MLEVVAELEAREGRPGRRVGVRGSLTREVRRKQQAVGSGAPGLRLGDEAAFANLYDQYIDKIYRFVFFKIKNTATSQGKFIYLIFFGFVYSILLTMFAEFFYFLFVLVYLQLFVQKIQQIVFYLHKLSKQFHYL